MNNFYVIKPGDRIIFGRNWAYADTVEPINRGDCEYCPVCGQPVTMLKWLPPYRIKLSSANPNKWGDFLWGADFPLIVSARFKVIYENEDLSGIKEFSPSVEIVRVGNRKSGNFPINPPVYHLIDVPWDGANQDDVASEVEGFGPITEYCSYHQRRGYLFKKQNKIVIEDGSWKGGDIFKPRGAPVQFMVSERFKQIADTYQLKNLLLIPADKYAYDDNLPTPWYIRD
jgi:hypothetical protein